MQLQNGKFYTTEKGTPVTAQMESDGKFHCYDAKGGEVLSVKEGGHVEGWLPCGRAVFLKARAALKKAKDKGKVESKKK